MSNAESPDAERVKQALFRGQKIEAIKIYREQTGLGLKESKDAVEKLEAELRISSPEKFAASQKRTGCLGVLLLPFLGAALWLTAR